MDGRDFGPPRSVHGPPPPLLSGLAMDSHRVGAATAGRLPASGLPGPLPPGKYMAGLNLHPHPGKCSAPCGSPLISPPPSPDPGELGPGNTSGSVPWRSQRWRGASLSAYSRRCEQSQFPGRGDPEPRAEASLEAPAEKGALFGYLPRRAGSLQGTFAGIGAIRGDSNTRAPATEAGLEFSKSGREKKPVLHPLKHLLPELESISWQTPLPAPVGPSSIPSSFTRAVRGSWPPRVLGCTGRTGVSVPGPWLLGGGRRP